MPTVSGSTVTRQAICTPTTKRPGSSFARPPAARSCRRDSIPCTTRSPGSIWRGTTSTSSIWPTACAAAIRAENPDAVLFANYSANRTWYYPEMYMGEYPAAYCKAVDVSSVELYWDVPGDALYQQFCCAFMQGVTDNRGGSVWIQPSEHGVSGVSSPVEIQLRGLEGAPWGIYPEFVESAGREEYFKQHVANVKAREAWWQESEPVPYIGIVASEQTRTLFAQGAPARLFLAHAGGVSGDFRKALAGPHPHRVRLGRRRPARRARADAARCGVPLAAGRRSRAAVRARRAAASSPVSRRRSTTRISNGASDFALADVLHAHYKSTHPVQLRSENIFLTIDADHPIVNDPLIHAKQATAWRGGPGPPPEKGDLALIASAVEATPADGGQVLMTYTVNQPERPASSASGADRLDIRQRARSRTFRPASTRRCSFIPDTYIRQLLANACRWAAADVPPPVEVEGPLLLSATTFRRQPQQGPNRRAPAQRPQFLRAALDLSETCTACRRNCRSRGAFPTSRNCAAPGRSAKK